MSVESVRNYLKQFDLDSKVQEFEVSSATVELAAQAAGVIPAMIAKTLSFKVEDYAVLIVTSGDTKVDNHKYKAICISISIVARTLSGPTGRGQERYFFIFFLWKILTEEPEESIALDKKMLYNIGWNDEKSLKYSQFRSVSLYETTA